MRYPLTVKADRLRQQRSESLAQSFVLELTIGNFAINPRLWLCIGNTGLPALANSLVRHQAPCGSGTRIIGISSSRNTCKNNLQLIRNN
jgi:hypothetical protein